jgi:hypothetical protein
MIVVNTVVDNDTQDNVVPFTDVSFYIIFMGHGKNKLLKPEYIIDIFLLEA